jgi:dienelactone hydrolase
MSAERGTRSYALVWLVVLTAACVGVRAAGAVCVGDCNGDGRVTIDELTCSIRISLGLEPHCPCPALDCQQTGTVTINCLILGVNNALNGCPLEPVAFTAGLAADAPALVITPRTALRGDTVYAVVLTSAVTDSDGNPVQPSAAFRALKGSAEPPTEGPIALFESAVEGTNPYPDGRLVQGDTVRIPNSFSHRGLPADIAIALASGLLRRTADAVGAAGLFSTTAPILIPLSAVVDLDTVNADTVRFFVRSDRRLEIEPLLQDLERRGLARDEVAVATSFPTQTIEDGLLAARDRLDETLAAGGLRVVLADPDPGDDLVIGVFHRGAPEFADFFADNPDVATVVHGLVPAPEFRDQHGLFDAGRLSGETAAAATWLDFYLTVPASPGPHRVVVLQHGFAGDNSFALGVANELAREGLAGIAISAVAHGRRGNFLDILSSTPLQVRDVFRQTNADQMALVRAIRAGIDLDADGSPDLDPTRLGYLGVSLGGIMGATFIAVEPSVQAAVLNVAGGRVAFLGDNPGTRPIYSQYYATLVELDIDSPEFEVFRQRLLDLGQQAIDPADPLNYARRWRLEPFPGYTRRRVLLQEGIGDPLVSNESTEALAVAGGLSADQPMSDVNGVSGLWRYPMGGHGIFGRPEVRAQALRFLASEGTEIAAP